MIVFSSWLLGIISAAIVLAVVNALVPKGSAKIVIRCVGGLAMLAVVLQPIIGIDWEDFCWEYHRLAEEIDKSIEQYQTEKAEELKTIIAESTGAYILDKAESLGMKGEVIVSTKERDGVPYPDSVTLTMPYHSELSQYIARELGIDSDHQCWSGEG